MKLKCLKHNRRVIAIGDNFVHRTGDGTRCDSFSAVIGTNCVTPVMVKMHSEGKYNYMSLNGPKTGE